jgi:hypothetical protein
VTHPTLLFVECADTIKPSIPIPDFGTETLYFFRFVKEQYSLLVKKPEPSVDACLCILAAGSTGGVAGLAGFDTPKSGGGERDRTDDLMLAKHALSQLSYTPDKVVGLDGFEPSTPRLSSVCSNQLSYRP